MGLLKYLVAFMIYLGTFREMKTLDQTLNFEASAMRGPLNISESRCWMRFNNRQGAKLSSDTPMGKHWFPNSPHLGYPGTFIAGYPRMKVFSMSFPEQIQAQIQEQLPRSPLLFDKKH